MKGKGAGEGFRRFRLGPEGPYLGLLVAHDLVTVKPFEGAANKTALIVLRKGIETAYPVPYFLWRRHRGVGSIPTDATLRHALTLTDRAVLAARPIGTMPTGAWQSSPLAAADALARLRGSSDYAARRGAATDPYGVFWLRVIEARPDGTVLVQNRPELGDRDIRLIDPTILESALIHPAIRGADIRRWFARPEVDVLVAQDPSTRRPYPSSDLKIRLPQTYRYLNGFRAELLSRGSNTVRELAERTEPWAMFGIGEYTFAPYRVTWKRMAGDLVAAVLASWHTAYGDRLLVPTDTTAFIPADDESEAHYLAALLNSTPVRAYVKSYSSPGRGFGAPAIVREILIAKYDPANPLHVHLAKIGQAAASAASKEDPTTADSLAEMIKALDQAVAELYGITDKELRGVLKTDVAPGPLRLH